MARAWIEQPLVDYPVEEREPLPREYSDWETYGD